MDDSDARDPLLHYILEGEARGCRPNAFFDPIYFAKSSETTSFYRYLKDDLFWNLSCCEHFDGDFYRSDLPLSRKSGQPLVDFWQKGFEEERNTSDKFNTHFFINAVCRDVEAQAKDFVFSKMTAPLAPPCTANQLEILQATFYAGIELTVAREILKAKRPNLVFVQCSEGYRIELPEIRSYDVLLNFYDASEESAASVEYITRQNGTKTTAIRKLLENRPDIFMRYEHIMFIDDDVDISPQTINSFFWTMEQNNLDLAQPSLTIRSSTYFGVLKQPSAGSGLTQLSAVEIMMPGLSKRALQKCGWVFSTGISGWAVDFLLGAEIIKTLGTFPTLIGSCVAEHLRPLDLQGSFYKYLDQHGLDANTEAGAITIKYPHHSTLWISAQKTADEE